MIKLTKKLNYLHLIGAFSLMALLNGLGVAELTKPELTGDWEFKLRQVQRRQLNRAEFMAEIRQLTERIVGLAKQYEHDETLINNQFKRKEWFDPL